jgi:pimeloyl-ACP methyl ester carboxylesterase
MEQALDRSALCGDNVGTDVNESTKEGTTMPKFEPLEIAGYQQRQLPNTFIRQEEATDHLAMLFPGYRYRATMPLLYYPELVLVDHGADVLRVEYAYDRTSLYQAKEEEREAFFRADVEAACAAGRAQGNYRRTTLVGKSIGTLAMGHLLTVCEDLGEVACIWLTPLLDNVPLCRLIQQVKPASLFVTGTADPVYDAETLDELVEATGGESVVIEGADHSLLIEDDVVASVEAMARVAEAVEAFLS